MGDTYRHQGRLDEALGAYAAAGHVRTETRYHVRLGTRVIISQADARTRRVEQTHNPIDQSEIRIARRGVERDERSKPVDGHHSGHAACLRAASRRCNVGCGRSPDVAASRGHKSGLERLDPHACELIRYLVNASTLLELANGLFREIPQGETLPRRRYQVVGALACIWNHGLLHLVARLQRQQVFVFRREQIRAVERKQRLALANDLTGVIDIQLANPSLELEIDVRESRFVIPYLTNGADCLLDGFALHGNGANTDQLLPPRVNPDLASRCTGSG